MLPGHESYQYINELTEQVINKGKEFCISADGAAMGKASLQAATEEQQSYVIAAEMLATISLFLVGTASPDGLLLLEAAKHQIDKFITVHKEAKPKFDAYIRTKKAQEKMSANLKMSPADVIEKNLGDLLY